MLLKKQEKDNVTKAIYASSNICGSTYDRTSKNLTIIFNNGGQYLYANVSETDYTRFELADSQGVVFNSHIKKHDFQKLDKVDTSAILTEVSQLKDAEKKTKIDYAAKLLVGAINAVAVYFETTGEIDPTLYSKMKKYIEEYDKITTSTTTTVVTD
jgi:hypothetical protein